MSLLPLKDCNSITRQQPEKELHTRKTAAVPADLLSQRKQLRRFPMNSTRPGALNKKKIWILYLLEQPLHLVVLTVVHSFQRIKSFGDIKIEFFSHMIGDFCFKLIVSHLKHPVAVMEQYSALLWGQ